MITNDFFRNVAKLIHEPYKRPLKESWLYFVAREGSYIYKKSFFYPLAHIFHGTENEFLKLTGTETEF